MSLETTAASGQRAPMLGQRQQVKRKEQVLSPGLELSSLPLALPIDRTKEEPGG